jgi:two-component system sensor histidine kinase UhpB
MSAQLPKNNTEPMQDSKQRDFQEKRTFQAKRWLLSWRSVTWQLIFLTILPLTALVVVIAFGSLTVHQNAMRNLVGERDERAVRTAAAALEEQLSHRGFAIRGLSQLAEEASQEKLDKILASSDYLLPEFDAGLAFFSPEGALERSMGDQNLWVNLEGQITPVIRDLLTKGVSTTCLSSAFTNPLSGEPMIFVFAFSPRRDRVAAGAFSAAEMVQHTLTNAFASGSQASVIVMDSDRRLLYEGGSFSYTGEVSDHPGVAEALRGDTGTTYVKVAGSEHVVAYSPIIPMGWAIVLEEPWEIVASPTLRASQMAPLVLVPVLILAVIALWFGTRQIVKPLQTLESRAATLAWGNFKAIEEPVGGIEEIRQLQAELIHMARKVQAAQESLHGYIGAITAAQEDERRRLARELHDDTIQALIALQQRVQLAQLAPQSAESHIAPESAALQEIATLTEQTIENLRRLTRALRPIYLEDLGLVTALEMLAHETGQAINITVEFKHRGVEKRLDSGIELALYRMAQEALSNIARHAQASHASLSITFTSRIVTIQVFDDGKGFEVPKSPAEFAPSGHYGLLGLHERAELIGATLEIRSAPGNGTYLNISLPLSPS